MRNFWRHLKRMRYYYNILKWILQFSSTSHHLFIVYHCFEQVAPIFIFFKCETHLWNKKFNNGVWSLSFFFLNLMLKHEWSDNSKCRHILWLQHANKNSNFKVTILINVKTFTIIKTPDIIKRLIHWPRISTETHYSTRNIWNPIAFIK